MKNITLKVLATAILMTAGFAHAEDNLYGKREELIKRFQNTKPLVVAVYNQADNMGSDMAKTLEKALPLSNLMSSGLNRLVVLDVDKTIYNLNNDVLKNSDVLYAPVLLSGELSKFGWKAVAFRNKLVSPVVIVQNSSSVKDIKDLKEKNIVSVPGLVQDYMLYNLIKSGVYGSKESTLGKYNKTEETSKKLLENLDNKIIDAIVMNEKEAKILIGDGKKYRLVNSTVSSHDTAIFTGPNLSEAEISQVKNFFINLSSEDPKVKSALVAIGENIDEKPQYVDVQEKELTLSAEVFRLTKLKEIFKKQ
jgi:hypothetical protein